MKVAARRVGRTPRPIANRPPHPIFHGIPRPQAIPNRQVSSPQYGSNPAGFRSRAGAKPVRDVRGAHRSRDESAIRWVGRTS
jgi:hypothetical protein